MVVGAGSALGLQASGAIDPGFSLLTAALANGLGLAAAVTATMAVSGGALNPAVTVALFLGRKLPGKEVVPYILAEVAGAVLAGGALVFSIPSTIGAPVNWGSPTLASGLSVSQGVGVEALLTFVLVIVVYGTAVDPRAPKIGGLGIGLAVVADVLVGGPLTGAAMNPARAMGPMLAGLFVPWYWYIYWVGPLTGAILATIAYRYALEARP